MNSQTLFLNKSIVNNAHIKSNEISNRIKNKLINEFSNEEELNKIFKFLNDNQIINTKIINPNINDSDLDGAISSFTNAGVGIVTLPSFYLTSLYKDNILDAIQPLNILNMGTRYIQWFGGELNGLPDRYHDHNVVPKVSVDVSVQKRPVISLQIAVETTLMEEFFNKEIRQSNLGLNLSELKARTAQRALINGINDLFYQGKISLGIYGIFNDPSLLPAVSLKESDWNVTTESSTVNFKSIIIQFEKIFSTLALQSNQNQNELNATLILPSKYRSIMSIVQDGDGSYSVSSWLKVFYPNIKIIFSSYANSQGVDKKPAGLIFNNNVSFDGVSQAPLIRPVGMNYMSTPISTNRQTLKVTQELYVAQTAGSILTSPYDVVALKWAS